MTRYLLALLLSVTAFTLDVAAASPPARPGAPEAVCKVDDDCRKPLRCRAQRGECFYNGEGIECRPVGPTKCTATEPGSHRAATARR